ncbi:hypothetical protein KKG58_00490 [Patescibacteria group bacterium]|nr:hypothetical protein [Patescibacteria group bacterium]
MTKESPDIFYGPTRAQILKTPEHQKKVDLAFEKANEVLPNLLKFDEQLMTHMHPDKEDHIGGYKLQGYIGEAFLKHLTKLGLENRFYNTKFDMKFLQPIIHDGTIVNMHFERQGDVKKIPNENIIHSKWRVVVSRAQTTHLSQEKDSTVYCKASFDLIGPHPQYIRPGDSQIEFDFKD